MYVNWPVWLFTISHVYIAVTSGRTTQNTFTLHSQGVRKNRTESVNTPLIPYLRTQSHPSSTEFKSSRCCVHTEYISSALCWVPSQSPEACTVPRNPPSPVFLVMAPLEGVAGPCMAYCNHRAWATLLCWRLLSFLWLKSKGSRVRPEPLSPPLAVV